MNQAQPLLWEHAAQRRARRRLAMLLSAAQTVVADYQDTLDQLRGLGAHDTEVFLHHTLLERAVLGAPGGQEAVHLGLGGTTSGAEDAGDTFTPEWCDDTEEQSVLGAGGAQ